MVLDVVRSGLSLRRATETDDGVFAPLRSLACADGMGRSTDDAHGVRPR